MKRLMMLLLGLAAVSVCASAQTFYTPNKYALPSHPDKMIVADFNHDGHADVAYSEASTGRVDVEMNGGHGAFHYSYSVPIGSIPTGLAVADFNGDGKLDLAVGDGSDASVTVVLGNGDGTFQVPVKYVVSGTPNSITVADFNGDGKRDIATLSPDTNVITVLTNTGTGFTFSHITVPEYFPSQYGGGFKDYPYSLVSGDFNGDHKADLAFVDQCGTPDCVVSQDVFWVLLNGGTSWTAKQAGTSSGTIALTAFDVDNDGRSDLVDSYYGCYHEPCTGVDVLFANSDGTFQTVQALSAGGVGGDPMGPAIVADFNLDGRFDVAVPVQGGDNPVTGTPIPNSFAVITQKSARAFNTPKFFASVGNLGAGFLNSDGKPDVAVANYQNNTLYDFKNSTSSAADPCTYPSSAGVHFCTPASSASVSKSAVKFLASAHPQSGPIVRMELWIDGKKVFQTYDDRLSRTVAVTAGSHTATIVSVDSANKVTKVNHAFTAK